MKAMLGEYKGKPTLTLQRDEQDKYPFTFGVAKAKLIVEHIETIKKFVNEFGSKNGNTEQKGYE